MENITVEITIEQIQKAFSLAAEKYLLKDSYDNPIKNAFERSIKEKEGDIKKIVDEIIVAAISSPSFKEKISDTVISKIGSIGIKKLR